MANRGQVQWTENSLRKGGALHKGWRFAFVGGQLPFYVAFFSGRICSCLLKCWTLRVGDIETCAARYVVISLTFHGMKVYSRDSSIHMTIFIHSHDDTSLEHDSYHMCSSSSCDEVFMTYHEREKGLHSEDLNDLKLYGRHFKLSEA